MTQQELMQFLDKENQFTQVMNYIQSGDAAGLDSWAKAHNLPIGATEIMEMLGELSNDILRNVGGGVGSSENDNQKRLYTNDGKIGFYNFETIKKNIGK